MDITFAPRPVNSWGGMGVGLLVGDGTGEGVFVGCGVLVGVGVLVGSGVAVGCGVLVGRDVVVDSWAALGVSVAKCASSIMVVAWIIATEEDRAVRSVYAYELKAMIRITTSAIALP